MPHESCCARSGSRCWPSPRSTGAPAAAQDYPPRPEGPVYDGADIISPATEAAARPAAQGLQPRDRARADRRDHPQPEGAPARKLRHGAVRELGHRRCRARSGAAAAGRPRRPQDADRGRLRPAPVLRRDHGRPGHPRRHHPALQGGQFRRRDRRRDRCDHRPPRKEPRRGRRHRGGGSVSPTRNRATARASPSAC